jgi:hypothetical protein
MTPYRGDVLRGDDGLPVVDNTVALISPAERRALLATLDAAKRPGSRQYAGKEPALLYGVVRCGCCGGLLYRATAAKKYRQYRCQQRDCLSPVGVARDALEAYVTSELLARSGRRHVISMKALEREDTVRLTEIEASIRETLNGMNADDADVEALAERLKALKDARVAARAGGIETKPIFKATGKTLKAEWSRADDVEQQRQLLLNYVSAVHVAPGGGRGRAFDPGRVEIMWSPETPESTSIEDILTMRAWSKTS